MGSILRVSSNLMPIFGVRKSKLIWPEGKKLVPLNLGLVSYHDPCLVLMCFFLCFECRNAGCLPHLESMLAARRIIADMCGTGIGWFFQHSPLYHLAEGEECLSRTEGGIPKGGLGRHSPFFLGKVSSTQVLLSGSVVSNHA